MFKGLMNLLNSSVISDDLPHQSYYFIINVLQNALPTKRRNLYYPWFYLSCFFAVFLPMIAKLILKVMWISVIQ